MTDFHGDEATQNGRLKKTLSFSTPPILNIFSQKFKGFQSVKIYRLAWMGLNFDDYPGFQLKITHANYYMITTKKKKIVLIN